MNNTPNNYLGHFVATVIYVAVVAVSMWLLALRGSLPTGISLFDASLLAIATFRLTHLFVYDRVANFIRHYFRRFESGTAGYVIHEILYCPWCTGIWMAWLAGFMYFLTPLAWLPIFLIALGGIGTFIQIVATLILRSTPPKKL